MRNDEERKGDKMIQRRGGEEGINEEKRNEDNFGLNIHLLLPQINRSD